MQKLLKRINLNLNLKKLILPIIAFVLAIGCIICVCIYRDLAATLVSQQAAEVFKGENEEQYSQSSAYFPVLDTITLDDVYTFRQTLQTSLTEAAIESEDENLLFIDAFSAGGTVTVEGPSASTQASAIGVGGNFFSFHPLELISGGYISESDLMRDRIVIDRELAWRLFGGYDLAGELVYINGTGYVIAGVVERESDYASTKSYADGAGLFMSYEALNEIKETGINCYELVCISPLSGFATNILTENFATAATLENSSRFKASQIFDVIGASGERSMNTYGGVFPYWENAARLVESNLAIALLFAMIFGIPVAVYLIVMAIIYWIKFYRKTKAKIPELLDERNEKRYFKKKNKSKETEELLSQGEENGERNAKEYQESI